MKDKTTGDPLPTPSQHAAFTYLSEPSMTLRQYLAGQALSGIASKLLEDREGERGGLSYSYIAQTAVRLTDEILKALASAGEPQ